MKKKETISSLFHVVSVVIMTAPAFGGKVKKVKWSRYRPGVAQSLCRVIALLFHDRGTGRG